MPRAAERPTGAALDRSPKASGHCASGSDFLQQNSTTAAIETQLVTVQRQLLLDPASRPAPSRLDAPIPRRCCQPRNHGSQSQRIEQVQGCLGGQTCRNIRGKEVTGRVLLEPLREGPLVRMSGSEDMGCHPTASCQQEENEDNEGEDEEADDGQLPLGPRLLQHIVDLFLQRRGGRERGGNGPIKD